MELVVRLLSRKTLEQGPGEARNHAGIAGETSVGNHPGIAARQRLAREAPCCPDAQGSQPSTDPPPHTFSWGANVDLGLEDRHQASVNDPPCHLKLLVNDGPHPARAGQHFWQWGRLIVQYLGDDIQLFDNLSRVLGTAYAGKPPVRITALLA